MQVTLLDAAIREPATDVIIDVQDTFNEFNQDLSGSNSSIRYHEPWKSTSTGWFW